jgi:hypothetical protein
MPLLDAKSTSSFMDLVSVWSTRYCTRRFTLYTPSYTLITLHLETTKFYTVVALFTDGINHICHTFKYVSLTTSSNLRVQFAQ